MEERGELGYTTRRYMLGLEATVCKRAPTLARSTQRQGRPPSPGRTSRTAWRFRGSGTATGWRTSGWTRTTHRTRAGPLRDKFCTARRGARRRTYGVAPPMGLPSGRLAGGLLKGARPDGGADVLEPVLA